MPAAADIAAFLATLPQRTLRLLRLALRLFELLPFPWRFSRMSLEAREQYLAKLEHSRFAPYRDLLLLAKTLAMIGYARDERVLARVGYMGNCAVRPGSPSPPPAALGELEPQGPVEECDVVIVGSGAGGAMAATRLAEAGLDVLVLEAGQYFDHRTYPTDPLEALPLLYRDNGVTIADGRPSIPIPVGRAVGGTTVINSGTCFRAPDQVLAEWRDHYGIPWAASLEEDYADAESTMQVKQLDHVSIGRNGQLCAEGAAAIGASGAPISRNAGDCVQCSSCPVGCPIDAKRAMHVSYLPRAAAAGARIRAGVEVDRVLVEGGRAVGVDGRVVSATAPDKAPGGDGDPFSPLPFQVRAKTVISAGGALGTPELLLRSGLGGKHIGRHLHVHPAAWIGGRYEEPVRGWEGVMQSYYVDQWHPQGLILEATFTPLSFGAQWLPGVGAEHQRRIAEFDHLGSIGVHLSDRSEGRVGLRADGTLRLSYQLTREEARKIHFGIARAAEIHFAAGAREVYPQVGPVAVIPRGRLADFEAIELKPSDLRLEAFHPMGTARMGADSGWGVTGPDGAVHGVEGLYLVDASLLPSSIGVNPMLTILAVASRVAQGIAERSTSPGGTGQLAGQAGVPGP
ncbi:MAG: GMC family oxidoreductase N-terminal domain-containing protein [Solirubrobacterales bacterium]